MVDYIEWTQTLTLKDLPELLARAHDPITIPNPVEYEALLTSPQPKP